MRSPASRRLSVKFLRFPSTIALQLQIDFSAIQGWMGMAAHGEASTHQFLNYVSPRQWRQSPSPKEISEIIPHSNSFVARDLRESRSSVSSQTQCDQCSRIHSFPSGGMRPVALSCSQRGRSHRQGQGNRGTDPFPHGGRSHLLLEKASPYLHALAPARCGGNQKKETTR